MKIILLLCLWPSMLFAVGNRNVLIDGGTDSTTIGNSSDRLRVEATQSGTWTVQPGNTANTTAWKVDGSAVTQPVSGTMTVNSYKSTNYVQGAVTVGTSQVEAKVGGSRLTNRQHLTIFNGSSNTIYIGPTGVTTSMRPLFKSQEYNCDDCNMAVYMIAASGGNSVIVEEKN